MSIVQQTARKREDYSAKDIEILEGLEPVRRRRPPGGHGGCPPGHWKFGARPGRMVPATAGCQGGGSGCFAPFASMAT